MRSVYKNSAAFLLLLCMLLCCICCGGGGEVYPFTMPPSNDNASSTTSPSTLNSFGPDAVFKLTVENALSTELCGIFISSAANDYWGAPVLSSLGSGKQAEIPFSEFGGAMGELYDIGTIDINGANYDCYDVVLLNGDRITLSGSAEKAEFTITRADGKTEVIEVDVYSNGPEETKRIMRIKPYLLRDHDFAVDSDNSKVYADYSFSSVRISGDDAERYPLLASALNKFEKTRSEQARSAFNAFSQSVLAEYSENNGDSFECAKFSDEAYIRMADENLLSVLYCETRAFGKTDTRRLSSINIVPITGARVMLSDVIEDFSAFPSLIYEALTKQGLEQLFDEEFDILQELIKPSDRVAWTLEPSGLTLFISSAVFGLDDGAWHQVFFSFGEYPELIRERYMPAQPNYAAAFPIELDYNAVIEGKRAEISVRVNGTGDDAYFRIERGAAFYEEAEPGVHDVKAHFVMVNGSEFLYLDMLDATECRKLEIFALEDGAVTRAGEFAGSWSYTNEMNAAGTYSTLIMPMSDPEDFTLYTVTDIIGIAEGYKTYTVGPDGLPTSNDPYYMIIRPDLEFTLQNKLELHLVSEAGEVDRETVILDEGSVLGFYRTDNKRIADLIIEDGRFVRAIVENGCIASIPIEELFNGIEQKQNLNVLANSNE